MDASTPPDMDRTTESSSSLSLLSSLAEDTTKQDRKERGESERENRQGEQNGSGSAFACAPSDWLRISLLQRHGGDVGHHNTSSLTQDRRKNGVVGGRMSRIWILRYCGRKEK
jgi:hypothetical protein